MSLVGNMVPDDRRQRIYICWPIIKPNLLKGTFSHCTLLSIHLVTGMCEILPDQTLPRCHWYKICQYVYALKELLSNGSNKAVSVFTY